MLAAIVAGLVALAWQRLQWVAGIPIIKFLLAHWGHALATLIVGIFGGIFDKPLQGVALLYAWSMNGKDFNNVLFESVHPLLINPDLDPLKTILEIAGFVGLLLIGFIIYRAGYNVGKACTRWN